MAGEGGPPLLDQAWQLLDAGKYAESQRKAKGAAEAFLATGDATSYADACRLEVLCLCQVGKRKEGARVAEEYWNKLHQEGARAAEARMLLALSEANAVNRGPKKRLEAFKSATDALRIFRELKDRRMEGAVLLVMMGLYLKGLGHGSRQKNLQDAVELGREALSIFQLAADLRLQAEALHALANARIQTGGFEAGLRHAKDALGLFHELGMQRSEFCENQCIAEALLRAGMPKQALPFAEEGLALCRRINSDTDWEASAVCTLVHVLLAKADAEKALQVAKEALLKFQDEKDKEGELLVLDVLTTAQLQQGELSAALESAEGALLLARDLGRREHEAALLRTLAGLRLRLHESDAALESAEQALRTSTAAQSAHASAQTGGRVASLGCVVAVQCSRGQPREALELCQQEREALHRAGNPQGEAAATLRAAALLAELGEGQRCCALASEARGLFREAADARGQAASLQLAARVHCAEQRIGEARRLVREALPLQRGLGEPAGEARLLLLGVQAQLLQLLAGDEQTQQDPELQLDPSSFKFAQGADTAVNSAREAATLARRASDGSLLGSTLCAQAQAQLLLGKAQEAVQVASAGLAVLRGAGDRGGEAHALLLDAQGLLCLGRREKAREAAGRALALFVELRDAAGRALAQQALSVMDNPPDFSGGEELLLGYSVVASTGGHMASGKNAQLASALRESVRVTVNEIVGLEDLQDDTPLMQMGLTSQSAVLLRNALTKEFPGPSLPFTMMFDYPSITHLTEFFLSRGNAQ